MRPTDEPWVKRIGATVGVLGSIVVAGWYALVAALSVPCPWAWLFVGAGVAGVIVAIRWRGAHPWRTLVSPIVIFAVLTIGDALWGWGA